MSMFFAYLECDAEQATPRAHRNHSHTRISCIDGRRIGRGEAQALCRELGFSTALLGRTSDRYNVVGWWAICLSMAKVLLAFMKQPDMQYLVFYEDDVELCEDIENRLKSEVLPLMANKGVHMVYLWSGWWRSLSKRKDDAAFKALLRSIADHENKLTRTVHREARSRLGFSYGALLGMDPARQAVAAAMKGLNQADRNSIKDLHNGFLLENGPLLHGNCAFVIDRQAAEATLKHMKTRQLSLADEAAADLFPGVSVGVSALGHVQADHMIRDALWPWPVAVAAPIWNSDRSGFDTEYATYNWEGFNNHTYDGTKRETHEPTELAKARAVMEELQRYGDQFVAHV